MNRWVLPFVAVAVAAAPATAGQAKTEHDGAGRPAGLRLTFLGTGAPRPSLLRSGPGLLVETDRHRLLLDAGSGLRRRLYQAGSFALLASLDHVVVSHLHYDHTIGIADLWLSGWLYGRRVPLRVQGPPGIAAMMRHLAAMYAWDVEYRVAVGVSREGTGIEAEEVLPGVVYDEGGLKITAFDVEHMPIDLATREPLDFEGRTYGYRIDYEGRSVVVSGDTRPSEVLVEMARGVDVLVHEVQVPSPEMSEEARLANVSLSVHSTPEQVAAIFRRTRPRMAVYSHIIPPDATAEELIARTRPLYDGPLTVAHDLMQIDVGPSIVVGERVLPEEIAFEQSRVLR